jgi:hypothetical protein
MRSFNTDRPTKSNVPYTVDAGHFQYEGDIFIFGFDNTTTPDTDNRIWVVNRTIVQNVTGYAEIYANWPNSPDLKNTCTVDFVVAWTPRPNFQLDVGINIGLVPAAIPYQIYMGIAPRF